MKALLLSPLLSIWRFDMTTSFFFGRLMKEESQCQSGRRRNNAHRAWRNSPSTSCTDGVGPSTPGELLSLNSERAKARAAAQANIELHLRSNAAWAQPCRISAEAGHFKKWAVSNEKRPPTSPDKTTRWSLPRSPTSPGFRVSLRRLATVRRQTSPCELAQTSCSPSLPPTLAPQAPVPRPSRSHKTPPRQS